MQPVDKLGKYDVQGVIGRGAVGVVYAAFDPMLARPVAIKAIPLDLSDEHGRDKHARFRREAQAAARMHHPHIVAVYDYGEAEGLAYIVMERLEGGSLRDLIGCPDRLGLAEVRRIMRDLLDGLHHSHEQGVVHRDVKPANVVFDADGHLKITDFGVARLDNADLTKEGSALGTPAYMSPEQVKGDAADARTDVYSAGVLLFEMLSGRRPFEGSAPSVMYKIITAPAPTLASLSLPSLPGLQPILTRALAKSPDDRFASATEMSRALEAAFRRILDGQGGAAPTATREAAARFGWPSLQRWTPVLAAISRRATPSLGAALIAGLVVTGIVAGGGWFWLTHTGPQTARRSDEAARSPGAPAPEAAPEPPASAAGATQATGAMPRSVPQAGELQHILDRETAALPCSFIYGDVASGGEVSIQGITGLSEPSRIETAATIRRALSAAAPVKSLHWDVGYVDGPYCSVLAALRSLVANPGGLSWEARTVDARAGSYSRIALSPTPALLLVDRFMPNGTVAHLTREEFSGLNNSRENVPKAVDLTGAAPGELIVATGWSEAVAPAARQGGREESAGYLANLRGAIERARRSGATITARIIFVAGGS